jgi:hypothetical protein
MAEQYCKNRLKDIVFMLNSENTFSFFMDGIISWLEASGYNYKYNINNNNNSNTLVIQFEMGKNWSLFFKTYMQSVLEYYKITDGQCEMTDNTVVIRINN